MQIKDSEIRRICSQTIYKRGTEYFKKGRVHLKTRMPDEFTATVDGTERYSVHVKFDGDKITDSICTCPYYRTMGYTCKHIVAALITRRKELEKSEDYSSENDRLAADLCNEFEAYETEIYHVGITVRITPVSGRISCGVSIRIYNSETDVRIDSPENFLAALCAGDGYLLGRNLLFEPGKCRFDESSEKIINLLMKIYESRAESEIYTPCVGEITVGPAAAKELLRLSEAVDSEYIIDGSLYRNMEFLHENPDILLDVTAMNQSITVSLTESGIALVPDGSIFFCEGRIFYTTQEWRQWFMPFYRNMISVHRTELEFAGKNSVEFAKNVLPNIKSKPGVVCYNVDEIVVNEKPCFEIYTDTFKSGISAVIKIIYGSISVTEPSDSVVTDKILIRNEKEESLILSYFSGFHISGERFILTDEEKIFEFLTESLPDLSAKAKIIKSDSFKALTETPMPDISAAVGYDDKVDLLKFTVGSSLSEKELKDILRAYCSNCGYYRFKNGSFLDFSREKETMGLLSEISELSPGLLKGEHRISKFYALYLAAESEKGIVGADKSFSKMISKAMHTYARIPDYLKDVLRDYQKSGVHWMKQLSLLGLGGILADDMGLGKTIQVIAFVMSENPEKPALIVVPSSLTYNWLNEINKFAPTARAAIIDGKKEERSSSLEDIDNYDFIITSYALLRRDCEEYKNLKFSYCFIDEAQNIKNARTKNAKAVKTINADRYFALTGTPIENSLSELWSIFDFIMHGYLPPNSEFSAKYEKGGEHLLQELRSRVAPFILRRMKSDVLAELPEKIENTIYSEFESEQKDIYAAFLSAARGELDEITQTGSNAVRILSLLTRLRQICCHTGLINPDYKKESGKLTLLKDIVGPAVGSGHRILIFSQFTSMLEIIKKSLLSEDISCFYLDGSTPVSERVSMAQRFNGGERQVFLISLKAGGTGLNLTGADTVIHYDPWWNPAVTDQASDRAYRIGQTKAVQIIKLVTKNSIEEQILKLSEKKRGLADNVIRQNGSLLSALTRDELLSLFK